MTLPGLKLDRTVGPGRYPLPDVVQGLESSPPLAHVFGGASALHVMLPKVQLRIVDTWGYMWVDDESGTLCSALAYWREGEELHLYLDLVHELVHVKQFHEGKDLFDHRFKYVARPTEVEAYRVAVEEARRLGMSDAELVDFLYVEWINRRDHLELCAACGVKVPDGHKGGRLKPEA
ncbi:MAG TPA: hypothetical protein VI997_02760 [Candidatus Thermoplasmatota archaeon]|nr:hypothetical protein [Candidatus Thermoplasmatota archaeon]